MLGARFGSSGGELVVLEDVAVTENVSGIIDQTNDGSFSQSAFVSNRYDLDLDQLAAQILGRDRVLLEGVRSFWLQNGLDLIDAKRLIGHGNFEAWCKAKLDYSKSKVEKLMRAAALFGSMVESGNLTDLPPRSLAYDISAPSVPQTLRDEYVPRLIAGEQAALAPAQKAIQDHKREAKKEKRRTALSAEKQVLLDTSATARMALDVRAEQQREAEHERQAAARSAAVDLIVTRLGDDLVELLALAVESGPSGIFSLLVERELNSRAQVATAASVEKGNRPQPSPLLAPAEDSAIDQGANAIAPAMSGSILRQNFENQRQRRKHAARSLTTAEDQPSSIFDPERA